jgi:hypothetical protein
MFKGMKTTILMIVGVATGYFGTMLTGCTGSGCTEEKEAICDTAKVACDTTAVSITEVSVTE